MLDGEYRAKVIGEFDPIYKDQNFVMELQPIQLTEEWLFKLGFIDTSIAPFEKEYKKGFLTLTYVPDNCYNAAIKDTSFRRAVNHVHDLQNLYYALMKQELAKT